MEKSCLINKHFFLFLGLILVFRIFILFFFQTSSNQLTPDRAVNPLGIIQNDYYMLLGPVDNYFETGVYELYKGSEEVFAGRMPGYPILYFNLRLLLPQSWALPALILLQIGLSCLATYFLAVLAYRWTDSKFMFYGTLLLFSISTYTSIFDLFTLAESFSVSAIIFCFYFLDKGLKDARYALHYLFFSGAFLCWAIFLRPFLGLLIIFLPILILWWMVKQKKLHLKVSFKYVIFFSVPFILAESTWVIRNYVAKEKIILLEEGLTESYGEFGIYGKAAMGIRTLINAYGGDSAEFRYGSDAWWFHHTTEEEAEDFEFPIWLLKGDSNRRALLHEIRAGYMRSMDARVPDSVRRSINENTAQQADLLVKQIRKEHPIHYFVINNFKRLKLFIFTNGTYLLPLPKFQKMNLLQKLIKLFYAGLYFFVLIFGLLGWLQFGQLREDKIPVYATFALMLSLIIAIVFVGGIIENRYFISMYPWLLIFCLFFFQSIIKGKYKQRDHADKV
jgi:hypothetical protein